MQPQTPQQQLDPTVVNMARAIKSVETSGQSDPYTAQGKSGEFGAYQYTPETWAGDSQKYLGQSVPLTSATVAQQNQVAYGKIKDLKSQGYNPSQIASIWNSGKPDATGNVGTNSKGVNYDTPQYVNSVVSSYNQFKSGLNPTPQPTASTVGNNAPAPDSSQSEGLLSKLGGRASDIGSNVADIAGQLQGQKGSQGWWSDLLQTGGDIAGGLGDVINSGLELIPGVKGAENWLGGEVGKAADTQIGKSVTSAIQSFSQAHPELSKDIGAGFNIVTAIPILKGLGVVKDIASSGLASALEGIASKGISKEITETAARTGGRNAISSLGNDLDNVVSEGIVKPRNLPDIVGGKYDVSEALSKTEAQRSTIAEKELQPLLDKASTNQVSDRVPLDAVRQTAIANAKDELQDTGAVNKMFDRIQEKYGDYPTLAQLNKAKQLVSKQVPQRAFDLEGYNANYNVRQTLQKSIEDAANQMGLGDVNAVNGKMRLLYRADDLLKSINGKPVKVGLFSKIARKGVSVGAGMLAEKMGVGAIGSLGVGYLTDLADKGIQGLGSSARRSLLERTSPGAFSAILKKGANTLPKAVAALSAQQAIK